MTVRTLLIATLLLVTLPACAGSRGDGPWTLRYALPAGESFALEQVRWQKNDRTFMGNRLVAEHRFGSRETFTVLGRDPDGLELEIRYGERWIREEGGGTDPDLSALSGARARFRLSATGERSHFGSFENLPVIRIPAMGDELNADRYRLELIALFPHLPGSAVRRGDSWTAREEFQDPNGGAPLDVELVTTYTCTGSIPGEDPELIGIDARFAVRVHGQVDAGGLLLDLDLRGEGEDRFRFDTGRGMVAGQEGTMWVEGEASNAEMAIEAPIRNDYRSSFTAEFTD